MGPVLGGVWLRLSLQDILQRALYLNTRRCFSYIPYVPTLDTEALVSRP